MMREEGALPGDELFTMPCSQEGLMRGPAEAGENQAVRWFRALGDETRLRIIDRLRAGEESVGNLADALATGQSRLSFHLRTLRDAGLVTDRRQGRLTYYSLDLTALHAIARVVESMQPRRADTSDRKEASGPAAGLP